MRIFARAASAPRSRRSSPTRRSSISTRRCRGSPCRTFQAHIIRSCSTGRCRRLRGSGRKSTNWWAFEMIDVVVPAEQEGTKAVVRAWLRQIGDRVEENDPLVELETDKVAMEVPAPAAGVLREILLNSDDDAVPGAILGRIAQEDDEDLRSSPAEAGAQPSESKPGP